MFIIKLVICHIFGMLTTQLGVDVWIIAQLHKNIWITLAKSLQQSNVCLSTGCANNH